MLVPGNSTTARKVYCSRELQKGIGNMTKHLLFLHAFMGCDTTSAFYKRVADIFNNPNTSQDCVAAAGEQFIVHLHGAKDWGWTIEQGQYKPVASTLSPAPGNMLHLVRCGCKGDYKCAGESCLNCNILDSKDEDNIEDKCDIEDHIDAKHTSASTREDYVK
ncbi:hypothetical protein PR048_016655 [Dryococelus australis]|uniref:Uncharacterized protein n=1 Tax=Dryococelus australis TaxID=614101 RepID=A0ABQ9H789_9NEOP|nr:hypothetical protein PR048_016655 [Dryococelus australis]